MPKKKNAITEVPANAPLVAPDFMEGHKQEGTQQLRQYVTPSRIKIVQKQADDELLQKYGVGDIIVTPDDVLLAEASRTTKGQPTGETPGFLFVPVFFYAEFCTWNDIDMKGVLPAIRERSVDPKSVIAQKAQNAGLRFEEVPFGEGKTTKVQHVEHLNFVVVVIWPEGKISEPVLLTFDRGNHGLGRDFARLIAKRKAPIYGCVFDAQLAKRDNEKGSWWGIAPVNPAIADSPPWVEEGQFDFFKGLHNEYSTLYQEARLMADYSTPSSTVENGDGDDGTF